MINIATSCTFLMFLLLDPLHTIQVCRYPYLNKLQHLRIQGTLIHHLDQNATMSVLRSQRQTMLAKLPGLISTYARNDLGFHYQRHLAFGIQLIDVVPGKCYSTHFGN